MCLFYVRYSSIKGYDASLKHGKFFEEAYEIFCLGNYRKVWFSWVIVKGFSNSFFEMYETVFSRDF